MNVLIPPGKTFSTCKPQYIQPLPSCQHSPPLHTHTCINPSPTTSPTPPASGSSSPSSPTNTAPQGGIFKPHPGPFFLLQGLYGRCPGSNSLELLKSIHARGLDACRYWVVEKGGKKRRRRRLVGDNEGLLAAVCDSSGEGRMRMKGRGFGWRVI